MGPQLTRAKVLNATQLPLLRTGIACIAASGTNAADVYVSSTLDLVNSPYTSVDVSAGYLGNTQPPISTCALANSNPTGQSLMAPVQYNPTTDGAVLFTNTITIQVPTTGFRMLQTIDDDVNSINGIMPTSLSQQVALVLQNLGSTLGALNPAMIAAPDGTYNGSALLQTASTSGFSPPSASILAQLGPWVKTLGRNVRITALSSIVLITPDTFNVMTVNDAMAVARRVLSPSPTPAAKAGTASSSTSGTVAGVVVGLLLASGIGVAIVIVRRRRRQAKAPASKSAVVRYVNSDRRTYVNTEPASMSFRTQVVPTVVKPNTVAMTPSVRSIYTPTVFRDPDTVLGINLEASSDTNTMKYFAPKSSISSILHKQQSNILGTRVIEDSNGRRGFTSELRTKPVVSSTRRLPALDSDTENESSVKPIPSLDDEQSVDKHTHSKSRRRKSSSSLSEEPRKRKSSRRITETPVEDKETPVTVPPKEEEQPVEEAPRKKKKSSRRLKDYSTKSEFEPTNKD